MALILEVLFYRRERKKQKAFLYWKIPSKFQYNGKDFGSLWCGFLVFFYLFVCLVGFLGNSSPLICLDLSISVFDHTIHIILELISSFKCLHIIVYSACPVSR